MTLIGLSGVAGCGKDFFSSLCTNYFESQGLTVRTFSFANEVKLSIGDFISDHFGFSSFTEDRAQKEAIRPIMVGFAEAAKKIKGDDVWVSHLFEQIKKFSFADVIIIKDVRFPVEFSKLKESNGSLIHISRYNLDGDVRMFVRPANPLESENDPIMANNADIKFIWPELTKSEAEQQVSMFLADSRSIIDKKCSLF